MKITENDEKYYCLKCGSWVYELHNDGYGMELCADCSSERISTINSYDVKKSISIFATLAFLIFVIGIFFNYLDVVLNNIFQIF